MVLALTILLGSLAVLANLIATGSRAASNAHRRTEAALLCKSKLAEILASGGPWETVSATPFGEEAPGWQWSLTVAAGPLQDLLTLEVTVLHEAAGQAGQHSMSLVRWVRDPLLFEMSAAEEEAIDGASTSGR